MKSNLQKRINSSLLYAIVAYLFVTVAILIISFYRNDRHFVYPLDDTYIHMAIAKNTALHGVWGVTQYQFTSSTSSPLWTGILALAFSIFGVNQFIPLVLNLLLGISIIIGAEKILRDRLLNPRHRFLVLLIFIFAAPLPTLTFISMEHVLHGELILWFLYLSAKTIFSEQRSPLQTANFLVVAMLSVGARYESLLILGLTALIMAWRQKWLLAFGVLLAGSLPIVLYGWWSISNGWYILPNSIMLKSNAFAVDRVGISSTLTTILYNVLRSPPLVALILLLLSLNGRDIIAPARNEKNFWNFVGVVAGMAQIVLAQTGWLYRYEAYIILVGIIALAYHIPIQITHKGDSRIIGLGRAFVNFVFICLFGYRIVSAPYNTILVARNIYEQPYQIALFVQKYYPTGFIAANDIGALTYFNDIHLIDLFGLGSMESARARLAKGYNTETIQNITQGSQIAILTESWYDKFGGLPKSWHKIGNWETPNGYMLGGPIVGIFAIDPGEKTTLESAFAEFSIHLPDDIKVTTAPR